MFQLEFRSTTPSVVVSGSKYRSPPRHSIESSQSRFTSDLLFRCSRCLGTACAIDGRVHDKVIASEQPHKAVDFFHYLGDTIGAGGGCEATITTRVRAAMGNSGSYFLNFHAIACHSEHGEECMVVVLQVPFCMPASAAH